MPIDPQDKKTIALNIQLSETSKEMLRQLKKDTGLGYGAILRDAIVMRYRMRFNNEPRCVDGQSCKCPHLHQIQQADKLTDAELMKAKGDGDAAA